MVGTKIGLIIAYTLLVVGAHVAKWHLEKELEDAENHSCKETGGSPEIAILVKLLSYALVTFVTASYVWFAAFLGAF